MRDDEFWKKMKNYFEELKDTVEEENRESRKIIKEVKMDQKFHINKTEEILNRLSEEPTWDRLMENEDFQELSEKSQKVIWELVKIKEGDSPKTQSEVADQYRIDRSRVSQLKQKMGDLNL